MSENEKRSEDGAIIEYEAKALDADAPAVTEAEDSGADEKGEIEIPGEMPVLPVRDIVVFTYMVLPLFVGREKSIKAVDEALNSNRFLFILTQKDETVDDPAAGDLYDVGTVCMIMRMLKMPDGRLKILVQGLSRARVKRFASEEPYIRAEVEVIAEHEAVAESAEEEALVRSAREQSEKIMSLRGVSSQDIGQMLTSVTEPRPPGRPHRLQPAHEGARSPEDPGRLRAGGAPAPRSTTS